MDRSVWVSAIVFVALAIVGGWLAMSPSTITSSAAEADGVRAIGAALLSGGLAAFIVVTLLVGYHERRG